MLLKYLSANYRNGQAPPELDLAWVDIQRISQVKHHGRRGSKSYDETVFYLTSMSAKVSVLAEQIRDHWHIENHLCWPKDTMLKEDSTPVCDGFAMANFAIVRTITVNLFRRNGFDSITRGIRMVAHDIE